MQLHELKRKTENKAEKRVGRGGGRGKTAGRGTKGQKARAGHSIMPAIREILKKLPKRRGYNQKSIMGKPSVVNLDAIEKVFASGDAINPKSLSERGMIRGRKGALPMVKILGTGDITKKFVITGCTVSGSAKEKIEKAGGSVASLA